MKTESQLEKEQCICGRCRECVMANRASFDDCLEELESMDFTLIGTGGNCTAYQHESDGYEWLITAREPRAPEEGDKVGLYCMKEGVLIGSWLADTLADLMTSLDDILQDAPRWQGRTDAELGTGEAFTEELTGWIGAGSKLSKKAICEGLPITPEGDANAKLIAAGPDMLMALRAAHDHMIMSPKSVAHTRSFKMVQDAINKATN